MLRLAVLQVQRNSTPALSLARAFASAPVKPVDDVVAVRRKQSAYYVRISRKYPSRLSMEAVDRTARYLTDRGLSQTQALRAISSHVMLTTYTPSMMDSKIEWLEELGLSHDKVNRVMVHHPNILGYSFERLDARVEWFISQGVPAEKMSYVFSVFPAAISFANSTLNLKVDFLKENGLDDNQIGRILVKSPQVLSYSVNKVQTNLTFLEELGVPVEKLPGLITTVPECIGLKTDRIQETVDVVDEMFGKGAGAKALVTHHRLVMCNISSIRRSHDYLLSVGISKEALKRNLRFLTRSVSRILRPRVKFLKSKGVFVVGDISWIMMAEGRFIQKYPDYSAYLTKYKRKIKEKRS
ncbi:Transcription termination factor MTERF5 [Phytophthora citrophthora]|uniref:Transcription termination factor MTERF5 n=1 Tax=Phytophthora citrophthora TaxID=4793 RepID=A0AAD9GYU5_9STRA|nr:Transcription termination factor MTERF5 [Phytophthora citrophthora]